MEIKYIRLFLISISLFFLTIFSTTTYAQWTNTIDPRQVYIGGKGATFDVCVDKDKYVWLLCIWQDVLEVTKINRLGYK